MIVANLIVTIAQKTALSTVVTQTAYNSISLVVIKPFHPNDLDPYLLFDAQTIGTS